MEFIYRDIDNNFNQKCFVIIISKLFKLRPTLTSFTVMCKCP